MKRNYLPVFLLTNYLCFCFLFANAQHPSIGTYNVYYGHLHNHTGVSDGTGTPEQAYLYARDNAHLDFFSLSEHSEMMTSTEWTTVKNAANFYNQDNIFTTFYGFEWSSINFGHVSVIGTEDYCSYLSTSTDNFSELLKWVNARSGIAFFNHPGWAWWAFQEFNKFTNTPSDKFVGIELWNDVDGFKKYYYNDGFYSNDGGKNYFDEALMRGWKIGAAGSDDNHVSTWGTRKPWRVGVLANALTRNDILNAFIARRFFSTLDNNLSLSLKINGAEMGSTVTGGTLELQIMAKDEDTNEAFNKVIIMKNGAVAETIILNPWINNVTITRTLTGVDKDYFYVKVTQNDGDEAISSPVFIQGTANQAPVVSITSPVNNASINQGTPVNIEATATDADGTITNVEFYQGTTRLGEVLLAPFVWTWTPVAGTYSLTAIATDNLGAFTVSAPVSVTITATEPPDVNIISKRIAAGSDDAEQYSKGAVILGDQALNMVYESKTTGNQIIGLRFTDLAIPKGATITTAYIEFTADKASSGSASLTIKGEAKDNATTFTTASKNISSRVKTTASVAWSPGTWAAGGVYKSEDLKTIVQEIVDRAGWISGNSMAFIITGTGTRTAESFEETPLGGKAPLLHIDYILPVEFAMFKNGNMQEINATNISAKEISEAGILVYPNPVKDVLTIRLNDEAVMERIRIYSVSGKLIKDIKVNQLLIEKQVDCNNLLPGAYLLNLSTTGRSYILKFIKQ